MGMGMKVRPVVVPFASGRVAKQNPTQTNKNNSDVLVVGFLTCFVCVLDSSFFMAVLCMESYSDEAVPMYRTHIGMINGTVLLWLQH